MSTLLQHATLLLVISVHTLSQVNSSSFRHKTIRNQVSNKDVEALLKKYQPRLLQFGSSPTLAPIPSTNPFLDAVTPTTTDIPTPAPVLDVPSFMSPSIWSPFLSPVPTQPWTDERVCEAIIDTITKTDFERSNNPCTCSRASEGSVSAPGTYGISCNYDYCEECIEGTDLCGSMEASYTYVENVESPLFTFPKETTACLQYTQGRDDKVCVTTAIDFTTFTGSCTIRIGDQTCNSCEFATCGSSSTTATSKSGDIGTDSEEIALSFDCSNIADGYSRNMCDYVPYTTTELPAPESTDPLVFLRFEKESFQSCANPSDPVQAPVPVAVAVPVPAPVQTVPTSVVVAPTASPISPPSVTNVLPTSAPASLPSVPVSIPSPPVSIPSPSVGVPTTTNVPPSNNSTSNDGSTSSAYFSYPSLSVTALSAMWVAFCIL